MTEDQRGPAQHAAHRILAANDPNEPDNPAEFTVYGNLFPHLLASEAVECGESWVRAW